MTRYALALVALAACTQVRDATLTHSGAQTTPAPCTVGEARCAHSTLQGTQNERRAELRSEKL